MPLPPYRPAKARLNGARTFLAAACLLTAALALSQAMLPAGSAESRRTTPPDRGGAAARLSESYGELPLRFEANRGQTSGRVKFLARGSGYTLFLAESGAVLRLRGARDAGVEGEREPREATLRLRLEGANRSPKIAGLGELPGRSNYLVGRDAGRWRTGVPAFGKVRYESVYPGIDAVYYGRQGRLEYDFMVAPGAEPARIRLALDGARAARVDEGGDLVVTTDAGDVRQQRPFAYQERDGARAEVAARYALDARGRVGFELGDYDRTRPLVIDPVLVYSSYLGGSGADQGLGVAVDPSGGAYVVGTTASTDFPGPGGMQGSKGNVNDAFVLKLNPDGRSLAYATYLGGNGDDFGNAVAVDSAGNAYVAGLTASGSFPVTAGAFQPTKEGGSDAFLAKLNPSGTALVYSTYIGGGGNEQALSVAVDAAGAAYVAGRTESFNFARVPTVTRAGSPAYRSTDGGATWVTSQAGMTASSVNAFALTPGAPDVVYAGTSGGVYRSADGGATWQLMGQSRPSTAPLFTRAVAVDPSNPAVIYAGTLGGTGLHKSTDGGITFDVKNAGIAVPSLTSLAIHPTNTSTVFAGTAFGLYRTTDGGQSWAEVSGGPSGSAATVNDVVVVPASPQPVVFAATSDRGVLKSTDGGASWAPANSGLTFFGAQLTPRAFAFDPTNTSTLYVSVFGFPGGVYKSTNGGANWANSGTGLTATVNGQTFSPTVNALLVDPSSPSTVYAATAGFGIYKSADGGANWAPVAGAGLANKSVQALALRPGGPAALLAGALTGNDGFVIKFNPAGSLPEYVRMLGGSENDDVRGVAVGAGGVAYAAGTTTSADFPLANAFQPAFGGASDAHVTKLGADGATVFATYLGGSGADQGAGVAVGAGGNAHVVGSTGSADFPVANALRPTMAEFDAVDAFVTKFAADGQSLAYSTYLGGASSDQAISVAVGADGGAYVAGLTGSQDFPQVEPASGYGGFADAFVARLNPAGSALLFSTYLGGAGNEQANSIAVSASGEVYVAGNTASNNFPLVSALRGGYGGGRTDAFVAKFGVESDLSVAVTESNDPVMTGNPLSYTLRVTNAGPSPATGVTLSYTLPPGVSFVSAAPSQGSCNASGQTVTCALGALPVSGSATVVVGLNPTAAGIVNSTANVTGNEPDHSRSNNSATAETKISASPSIRGRVTAPGGAALAGVAVTLSGSQQAMVQTDAGGFYQFAEVAAGGNYVVTPSKEGVSFEPPSRAFNNLSADQTADFTGANCTWTLTPATRSFGASGGGGGVTVNTLRGCPWTAASGSDWITVTSGASGTETGTVSFTVAPSAAPRAGRLTVAGQNFPVYQEVGSCGAPEFTAASYNLMASGPTLVEAGDLNGDGLADLVVATNGISGADIQASVMINDGAGGFTSSTFGTGLGGPQGMTLGDFNSDARPDIAMWGWVTPYIRVLYNNGSGGFGQSAANVQLGVYPAPRTRAVSAADVNRDGKADLLVTTPETNNLRVLLGDGAGGFTAAAPVPTSAGGAGFSLLDVADVNGDGKPDLLLGSNSTPQISARLGDGAGGFGDNLISAAITFPSQLLTGDFDADGRLDVVYPAVVCDFSGSNCSVSIAVMAGDGAGRFTQRSRTDNTNAFSLAVADFNADGKLDVAQLNQATGAPLVRRGDGLGGFVSPPAPAASESQAQPLSGSSAGLATADFNKDGRPDLAAPGYNVGAVVFTNRCASGPSISGRVVDTASFRGLAGVTVSVAGAQAATAVTDEGGNYFVGGLTAGAGYTVTPTKENYRFSPASAAVGALAAAGQTADFSATPMTVRLAAGHHVVDEHVQTFLKVDVVRAGDTTGPATVNYSTGPGTYNTASDRSDYTYAGGTLRFAAGETVKSFNVLLNDDRLLESWESFTVSLSAPTGAILGPTGTALVEVRDNELSQPPSNPIDESHVFVRQHYHDFLNREPDQSGLDFWTWEIEQCGADAACREVRRINVSAAFFLSIEFQETGYLVYRTHTAAFATGRALDQKTFLRETQDIGLGVVVGQGEWKAQLEANKQAYVNAFVQRPEFVAAYPQAMTPAQFVDALNANTGGSLSQAERDALVAALASGAATRAGALRSVAENAEFSRREFNKAFVLTQYFGYLRRGPAEAPDSDFSGWQFWLGKLDEFGGDYIRAEMVKAFISSDEYRKRFGQ